MSSRLRFGKTAAATAYALAISIGSLVAAGPAAASSYLDCPNNYVCLYSGTGYATKVFQGNASVMHDNPNVRYGVPGSVARSAINTSLGTFCTFKSDSLTLTNVISGNTHGNLAQTVAYYIGAC